MHEVLKTPRHGCGLHGALRTVEALSGVVPVVHANSGCVYQHYLAEKAGHLAEGNVYGPEIPATEVIEKQVVFGGASRLREQIKNTAKVIEGSLYVILGSCEAAMVGDDLAAMTKEALDVSLPVVFYFSAGFKGTVHGGYAGLMRSIIRQLPEVKKINTEKIPGLVNILGILPKTDIFYKGDILEMKRILGAAGLEANAFFGPRNGAAALERGARAEHTIVFSSWGIPAARELRDLYGIPYTVFESLPLGIEGVTNFFERLASNINVDRERLRDFLDREEEMYRYFLKSLADTYYAEGLKKNIILVGDTNTVHRLGCFLPQAAGAVIHTAILTDIYGYGKEEPPPSSPLPLIPEGLCRRVFHTGDSDEIEEIISAAGAEMVLGSVLEAGRAKKLKIPHLIVSGPNGNQILLHKTYSGITGACFLLEDYANAILLNNSELRREKRQRLESLNPALLDP
jgi:nitrogenase molybdenum-iron protein beta chain